MVKRCLVLGSANNLRDDLRRALRMAEYEGVIVAKGAGLVWKGKVDAWVSLHPDRFMADINRRKSLGFPDALEHVSHVTKDQFPGVDRMRHYKFEGQRRSGSSGLFAVLVAKLDHGYDRIVLCGMPLEKLQGRLDGKDRWNGASSFKTGWLESLPHIKNSVRSMSGWTKTHLGAPTPEWLS